MGQFAPSPAMPALMPPLSAESPAQQQQQQQQRDQRVVFMRSLPDSLPIERCSLVFSGYLTARPVAGMLLQPKAHTTLFRLDGALLVCLEAKPRKLAGGRIMQEGNPFGGNSSKQVAEFREQFAQGYPYVGTELCNALLALEGIQSDGPDMFSSSFYMPKWSVLVSDIVRVTARVKRPCRKPTSPQALTFLIHTRQRRSYELRADSPADYHRWTFLLARLLQVQVAWGPGEGPGSSSMDTYIRRLNAWHGICHELIDTDPESGISFTMVGKGARGMVSELGAGQQLPALVHRFEGAGHAQASAGGPSPMVMGMGADAQWNAPIHLQDPRFTVELRLRELHAMEEELLSMGLGEATPSALSPVQEGDEEEEEKEATDEDEDSRYLHSLRKVNRASARLSLISRGEWQVPAASSSPPAPAEPEDDYSPGPGTVQPAISSHPAAGTTLDAGQLDTEAQEDLEHCLDSLARLLTQLELGQCAAEWRARYMDDCVPYFLDRIATLLRTCGFRAWGQHVEQGMLQWQGVVVETRRTEEGVGALQQLCLEVRQALL